DGHREVVHRGRVVRGDHGRAVVAAVGVAEHGGQMDGGPVFRHHRTVDRRHGNIERQQVLVLVRGGGGHGGGEVNHVGRRAGGHVAGNLERDEPGRVVDGRSAHHREAGGGRDRAHLEVGRVEVQLDGGRGHCRAPRGDADRQTVRRRERARVDRQRGWN